MSDHDVLENEAYSVTFTCKAFGQPLPTIGWYFNDIMLIALNTNDHNITVTTFVREREVDSSLRIINPVSSDAGTYTCHAENVVGSDNSSGLLTVNGT